MQWPVISCFCLKRSRQIWSSWLFHRCTNTWLVKTRKHRSSKTFSATAVFNGKQRQNATLIRACKSKCICLCLHLLTTLQPSLFAPDRFMETSQKNIFFSRDFRKVCLKFTPHLLETWLPFFTWLHIPAGHTREIVADCFFYALVFAYQITFSCDSMPGICACVRNLKETGHLCQWCLGELVTGPV